MSTLVSRRRTRTWGAAIFTDEAYAAVRLAIDEASFRREEWDEVLRRLSVFAGAVGVAVIPIRGSAQGVRQTESLDALADTYVSKGWAARDYRYRGVPKMLAGQVSVDSDFVDYETFRREPYYEDFLRPLGFRYFAGLSIRNGDDAWAVTFQRSATDKPYSVEEQARLATLIAPLQAAVKIDQALGAAYQQGTLDRLDSSATACVLINRMGLVAHMNRAAEALVGHTLTVTRGVIRLLDPKLTAKLHAQIAMVLQTESHPRATPRFVQREPNGASAFEVLSVPEREVGIFGRYRCMVLIHGTTGPIIRDVEAFRSMFALARRESALVSALSRSLRLVDAARDLGISHETARSQLKSIFHKTGTRSQSELLILIEKLKHVTP